MKLTKLVALVLVTTSVGSGAVLSNPMIGQAKRRPKTTIKTFPKAIRGKWYARYYKMAGKPYYHEIKFTPKTASWKLNVGTNLVKQPLHAHKLPFHGSKTSQHQWVYAINAHDGTNVQNWNSTITLPMAGYWRTRTKKYKGHKIKTLQRFNPKTKKASDVYYPSKKIASYYHK
ncbi:hypothetical protein D1831_08185 [Lactiplantibacillus garii]|uniref:Extracellular protein n=1 Tax=Lactiplantibacillus garii TaxID=2306423 RepID=A0A3R8KL58_9LACO|nr:hypothetical protein [Lactiplantibacillus garii]RRK10287.1 hypothetical protein D1831_08185 [Lactiplantibacillus garii]